MARKIVITSGKGGVGKTTVTANLGLSLASLGYRVIVIDADFGLNNLDVVLGLENKVVYNIVDVLDGKCRVKQALVQDNKRKNLFLLSSGNYSTSPYLTGQNIKLLIESVSSVFDFVLIDCPAGIDIGFHRAVSCVDEAIVVVTPNLSSVRDSDKVVAILKSYKLDKIKLVVNRARGDLILNDKMIMPLDIQKILKIEMLGVLPEEDSVFLSCGENLPKSCDSNKAYKILASNLIKNKEALFDVTEKYQGILGSIRRRLKKSI